ncbi:MAG: cytochrome c-type biogenesis protein CcmH [Ilumatobacteraceae bacterium]
MTAATTSWNQRVKSRRGWAVLLLVVIAALAIGSLRSTGPLTDDDRADEIAQNLACPVCAGESVYESQSGAAQNIRNQIKALIQQGTYSDDEIKTYLEDRFETKTQLVPKGTGLESLVWILPVVGLVAAVVGLTIAFRRWKMAADTVPTDDDRAIVAEAMRNQSDDDDG